MKKLLLLCSIAIVAAFGINVATASAASCSFSFSNALLRPPGGTPAFTPGAQISWNGCTDVDYIKVYMAGSPGSTGLTDVTEGGNLHLFNNILSWTTQNAYYDGAGHNVTIYNNSGTFANASVWMNTSTCWYTGQHNFIGHYGYYLHSYSTGSWGSYITGTVPPGNYMNCSGI